MNHPNICTLHDVGPDYLVMEIVFMPTATVGETPKAEHTVMLVQNFFDELRRRVPVGR